MAALLGSLGCAAKTATEAPAEAAAPGAPVIPYDREKTLESFEVVWRTVNEKHWDPAHGGVDWDAVHEEFRPRIEAATSMNEARGVMGEMLRRLGQSHFGIWPREIYLRDEARATPSTARVEEAGEVEAASRDEGGEEEVLNAPGKDGGVSGLDVRVVGEEAIVTRVRPGSGADMAGVRPGWLLVSADGQGIEQMSRRVEEKGPREVSRELSLAMLIQHLLAGDVGETIEAEFVDGEGTRVEREITLRATTGTAATLGNLPTFYLEIDHERLPENVEYFRFSMFMDPPRLMGEFQKSVESAKDADGFIIDLRGNPGGIGGLAMGMGGWFVDDDSIKLGTMTARSGTLNFVLNPRVRAYMGPLAILIDGMSGSTSEIFAGGMKDIGRARIFGERSAGAALPSVFDKLPNGDRFQYAIANYVSVSGEALEGRGVEPDEVVKPDRASLLAGRDPVLEAALEWIASQKKMGDATGGGGGGRR